MGRVGGRLRGARLREMEPCSSCWGGWEREGLGGHELGSRSTPLPSRARMVEKVNCVLMHRPGRDTHAHKRARYHDVGKTCPGRPYHGGGCEKGEGGGKGAGVMLFLSSFAFVQLRSACVYWRAQI